MKKFIFLCIASCIIGFLIGFYVDIPQHSNQDFKFYQSFSSTHQNYRETVLKVIIYRDNNIPELFEEIREFHAMTNGKPDKLTVQLYKSKDELLNGNAIDEKIFYVE